MSAFWAFYGRLKIPTVFPHETNLFLKLEIQRSQYIRPKVTVRKGAETIQGWKLYEEIWYLSGVNLVAMLD